MGKKKKDTNQKQTTPTNHHHPEIKKNNWAFQHSLLGSDLMQQLHRLWDRERELFPLFHPQSLYLDKSYPKQYLEFSTLLCSPLCMSLALFSQLQNSWNPHHLRQAFTLNDVSKRYPRSQSGSSGLYQPLSHPIKPTDAVAVPKSFHIFPHTAGLPPTKTKFSPQLAGPKKVPCSSLLCKPLGCSDLAWSVSIGMHP